MNAETPLSQRIRLVASNFSAALFRNLVGKFQTVNGDYVNCGLGPGSSDLVGWTRVTITQDMVGKPAAIFTAVEVKVPGAHTDPDRLKKQTAFIDAVKRDGGRAGFASSEADAVGVICGR